MRLHNDKIPCSRDCKERSADCHSTCEKYLAFRKKREAVYANRQKYLDEIRMHNDSKKKLEKMKKWSKGGS